MVTEINHNRPQLRLLDNLRREMARNESCGPGWFTEVRNGIASGSKHVVTLNEHLGMRWTLRGSARVSIDALIDAFITFKSQPTQSAHRELVHRGISVMEEAITDFATGRDGIWNWLSSLSHYDEVGGDWEDLKMTLTNESLSESIRLGGYDPAYAARLRAHFTNAT